MKVFLKMLLKYHASDISELKADVCNGFLTIKETDLIGPSRLRHAMKSLTVRGSFSFGLKKII